MVRPINGSCQPSGAVQRLARACLPLHLLFNVFGHPVQPLFCPTHPTTPQTAEAAVGQTGRALLQEAAVREEGAAQDEGIDPVHPLWGQREDKQIQVGGREGGGGTCGWAGLPHGMHSPLVLHVEVHVEIHFPATLLEIIACKGFPVANYDEPALMLSLRAVAAGDGVCGCCLYGGAAAAAGGGAGGAGGKEGKACCHSDEWFKAGC